jgi:GTP-binding protein Era
MHRGQMAPPPRPKDRPRDPDAVPRAGTVALLGRPNVGKSTLLNALLGERIAITSHHPQTTRDRIAGIVTRDGVQAVFLDTPGIHAPRHKLGERMNDVAKATAQDADVLVFMTDLATEPSPKPRPEDLAILAAIPAGKPTVLVLNKVDRVGTKSMLIPTLEGWASVRDFAAIVPVCALRSDGVDRVLREVEKVLPEGEPLYAEDEITDKPVRFFVAEFVREQILRRTRQEVPHGVAVTVESFDEGPKMVRIAVTVHVAKESHKAILIGDGGKMLGAIGTAARKRAEELLGRKVHLQTFVRATPRWFDDAAQLADMGYAGDAAPKRAKKHKAPRRERGPGGAPRR